MFHFANIDVHVVVEMNTALLINSKRKIPCGTNMSLLTKNITKEASANTRKLFKYSDNVVVVRRVCRDPDFARPSPMCNRDFYLQMTLLRSTLLLLPCVQQYPPRYALHCCGWICAGLGG
jgi:hypothetical protein